jgi:AraC-like DNA-binding protein/mannose-6-phosphate isomerase-like protein (cupin superfamily)
MSGLPAFIANFGHAGAASAPTGFRRIRSATTAFVDAHSRRHLATGNCDVVLSRLQVGEARVIHRSDGDQRIHFLVGGMRSSLVHETAGIGSIWSVCRGQALLTLAGGSVLLSAGDVVVVDGHAPVEIRSLGRCVWTAALLPPKPRAAEGEASHRRTGRLPSPVPALYRGQSVWARRWLRLMRQPSGEHPNAGNVRSLNELSAHLATLQDALEPLIGRCPGRTLSCRRKMFTRLQRARLHAEADVDGRLGITQLARVVGMSPSHFARIFHHVYGMTPHKLLTSVRLRRALELVGCGELGVAEIAHAVGFTNRCSFSRWFHQQTGHTAVSLLGFNDRFAEPTNRQAELEQS